jgi:hypothetical protein
LTQDPASTESQKQSLAPNQQETLENIDPFRLVVPSSWYPQQSRMVLNLRSDRQYSPSICNVTVPKEMTPIRGNESYRPREMIPIRGNESYRPREMTPIRSNESYRPREITPIRGNESYRSYWTRDVNGELQLIFVFI